MSWVLVAIIAYFLVALEVILDKFLLSSKRVSHPAIYAFYSGILSLTALFFVPFGFHGISWLRAVVSIFAGIIFVYGILNLFFAINKSQASQVTPVVGAVIPLVTLFLSVFFLDERLKWLQIWGIAALISGGLLISFNLPLKINKKKFFHGFYYSIAAGIFLALAFTWFKHFYEKDNFINVFVWTRIGLFAGAISLFAYPAWRRAISNSLGGFRKPQKENVKTGTLFVVNKGLGGIGSIMTNFAISLGSVTIVNALISTEYIFILFLGVILSAWLPKVFREKSDPLNIFQKVASIAIITAGVVLISFHRR